MEYEKIIKLSEEITSQGNKANLTQKEALLWAMRDYYCREAAKLSTETDDKDEITIAETMVDIISLTPDYISALGKIANYIQHTTS